MFEKGLMDYQRRCRRPAESRYFPPVAGCEGMELDGGGKGLIRRGFHRFREKFQPCFPITRFPYPS